MHDVPGAFNICCPRDCVSRHKGGTSGAPLKPLRDDSALSLEGLLLRVHQHVEIQYDSFGVTHAIKKNTHSIKKNWLNFTRLIKDFAEYIDY